jgi:hypothetical protein
VNFDIGEILTRAWQITWKHKILWVLCMFPILLSFLFIPIVFIPMFFIGPNSLVSQRFVDEPYYISLFLGTNFFLIGLSILLYVVGAAGTSLGVLRLEKGQERLLFWDLLQDGLEYFWRILGTTLLIGAGILLVFLLVFGCMILVSMATLGLGMICLQPLFLLLYPAILLVYSLTEESQAAVVADNLGISQAIARGWAVMRTHFWKFLLITLIIYLGIFILSSIVTLPFMIPFFFLPLVMGNSQTVFDFQRLGWVIMAFSLVLLPILALVQGISLTFIKSAFMIIYLRSTRSPVIQAAFQ